MNIEEWFKMNKNKNIIYVRLNIFSNIINTRLIWEKVKFCNWLEKIGI